MQHQNSQMERWSVGAWSALLIDNRWEANWQSLGSVFYVLLHLVIGAGHILFDMFFAYFFVVSLILVTFATT